MNKKRLIINADDFGWDSPASIAILELARNAKITSTTVMSNFVQDKHLEKLAQIAGISVGLHVNVTDGFPLCKPEEVPSLVSSDGEFVGQKTLLSRAFLGKLNKDDLQKEISAQISVLQDQGIKISHADGHKHIHQYPVLGPMILKILKKEGITKVRNCKLTNRSHIKMLVVDGFAMSTHASIKKFTHPHGLIPDFSVYGYADIVAFRSNLLFAYKEQKTLEFMTHPATENKKGSYLNRKAEYEFWKFEEWKSFLEEEKIELITYNDL